MENLNVAEWEIRLAFLENNLEKLSDVVREQADETLLLKKEVSFLKEKIWDLERNKEGPESAPPPHY